ncbi:MAG: 50S ribosomal protein L6 [Chloroflexi bacterium]|nr:50S ribosomal protein L6 [Chloroflexota bacterium]
MSRIGKLPIPVPEGVTVEIAPGNTVTVKGPKGQLTRTFSPDMIIELSDGVLTVKRPTDSRMHKALHGLTRALLANMVTGVTEGFRKDLEIRGVGYRADLVGDRLILQVGFSHPVEFQPPPGITFEVDRSGRNISVQGIDKELVGLIAAKIRDVRPPEPYKGKGIRYVGEWVRQKAGKAGRVM